MMLAPMSARRVAGLAAAVTMLTATGCTLNRPEDPVVIGGAQVPALHDVSAGDVVAFRWFNDAWHQVPVQVDERKSVDLGTVYNTTPVGFVTTVYADPGTFTGADPNADVDADDELALMARDVGLEAPSGAARPAGTNAGGVKVRVVSTLGGDHARRLGLPVRAQRRPQPGGRRALRRLRVPPAVRAVQDDVQGP